MSYLPPHADMREGLGFRVVVPWRGELRVGVVVGWEQDQRKGFALREAVAYLDKNPWLRPEEIAFLEAAAKDSFCALGSVLDDLIPFLEPALDHRVRLLATAAQSVLPKGMETLAQRWQEARGFDPKLLDYLREAGVLEEEVSQYQTSKQVLVPLKAPDEYISAKARVALQTLHELGQLQSMAALARAAGVGVSVVKGLVDKGYAGFALYEPLPEPAQDQRLQPLNLPEIRQRLDGGRLNERIRALTAIAQNESVLVLFPEVALLKRFQQHFPQAAVLHGEMKAEERRKVWERLADPHTPHPRPHIVLSTYQGLLLPFTPVRMVVVEEASEAYKLSAGSRAFIPHLAQLRTRMLDIPLTFLSSISSVEVLEHPGQTLPLPKTRLHLLDMRQERGWPISGAAIALLQQAAEKGRQAIVLSGRRGYSAVLRCKNCDWKAMCPNCTLPLRYHRSGRAGLLQCHQCGHEQKAPNLCPKCQSDVFDPKGPGVEWLLEALSQHVPDLPRFRYTSEAKDDLAPLLSGKPGVLVGTTAILRGPVLPELALVLLPYADGFILESDFRASERYHRLLWQLADLHPRRHPLLVLQTFEPNHSAHKSLEVGDPEGFIELELSLRRALGYPPATRILKLEVSHPKEPQARDGAEQIAALLRPNVRPGELLGPAPAPVARVRGQYVFHLLLKSSGERLHELMAGLPLPRGARVRLDPDPQSFVGLLED